MASGETNTSVGRSRKTLFPAARCNFFLAASPPRLFLLPSNKWNIGVFSYSYERKKNLFLERRGFHSRRWKSTSVCRSVSSLFDRRTTRRHYFLYLSVVKQLFRRHGCVLGHAQLTISIGTPARLLNFLTGLKAKFVIRQIVQCLFLLLFKSGDIDVCIVEIKIIRFMKIF